MSETLQKLVFLRHGITSPQEQGRYCGHLDPPLSASGREQVIRSKDLIFNLNPTHVWSSDLRRCTETASLIFPSVPHRTLPEMREIAFGDFENRLYSEIGPEMNRILLDPDSCFPGGESRHKLGDRVVNGMRKVLAEPGDTALVIGHAGSIAAAALWLLGRPLSCFWSFQLPHVGSAVFEHSSGAWIEITADWKAGNLWPA